MPKCADNLFIARVMGISRSCRLWVQMLLLLKGKYAVKEASKSQEGILQRRAKWLKDKNHRYCSKHIEKECCLGLVLADIWQLLRWLDKVQARVYKICQLPLHLKFSYKEKNVFFFCLTKQPSLAKVKQPNILFLCTLWSLWLSSDFEIKRRKIFFMFLWCPWSLKNVLTVWGARQLMGDEGSYPSYKFSNCPSRTVLAFYKHNSLPLGQIRSFISIF